MAQAASFESKEAFSGAEEGDPRSQEASFPREERYFEPEAPSSRRREAY